PIAVPNDSTPAIASATFATSVTPAGGIISGTGHPRSCEYLRPGGEIRGLDERAGVLPARVYVRARGKVDAVPAAGGTAELLDSAVDRRRADRGGVHTEAAGGAFDRDRAHQGPGDQRR